MSNISIIKKILKRIRLRTLITLIILLVFNTYAWFVFSTRVVGRLQARVESWDVIFEIGNEVVTNIDLDIESLFPGMQDHVTEVTAFNRGGVAATLTYRVIEMTIFGVTYTCDGDSDLLGRIASEDFPFHITVGIDNEIMDAQIGESVVTITVSWPFEQGNDELDTYFGRKAAEFNSANPTDFPINILIELRASQNHPEEP